MKKVKSLFIVLLPILILGACNPGPVEPIIPRDSIVITSVTIEVTATSAVIKVTVITNKSTTVFFEYGEVDYTKTVTANPNPVNGNMEVSAKISDLTPNTTYKFRVKTGKDLFLGDSTFVTKTEFELQFGESYKNGTVIREKTSNVPGLLAAKVDQSDSTKGMTYEEAIGACKNYGEGYYFPDSTEVKIIKRAYDSGILNNIVRIGVTIYLSSTVFAGNPDYIHELDFKSGKMGLTRKLSRANVRAVCKF